MLNAFKYGRNYLKHIRNGCVCNVCKSYARFLMAHGLSDLRKDWLSYGLQLGRLFNA